MQTPAHTHIHNYTHTHTHTHTHAQHIHTCTHTHTHIHTHTHNTRTHNTYTHAHAQHTHTHNTQKTMYQNKKQKNGQYCTGQMLTRYRHSTWAEVGMDQQPEGSEHSPGVRVEGPEPERPGVVHLSHGEHQQATLKVLVARLPHQEGVAEDGEDESDEDQSRVAVVLAEAHAMEEHEEDQRDDGQAFRDAEQDGGALAAAVKHEVDGHGFEEGHQLGSHALQLKADERCVE